METVVVVGDKRARDVDSVSDSQRHKQPTRLAINTADRSVITDMEPLTELRSDRHYSLSQYYWSRNLHKTTDLQRSVYR